MKRLHPTDDGNRFDTEGGGSSNRLADVTHIIMDEIHERDKNTEFLMIALQDLLDERDDLQLILMSATMPTRDLAEYWCGVGHRRMQLKAEQQQDDASPYDKSVVDDDWGDEGIGMPVEINIPGRTFPVQEFFLEDVLSMTGFVSEAHTDAPDMKQIEDDLLSLLGGS